MLMNNESKETQFRVLETDTITARQYERARNNLQAFTEIDSSSINTLDDVYAYVFDIGQDIRSIVLASAHIEKITFRYKDQLTSDMLTGTFNAWIIREPVENHTLVVTADSNCAYIEAYKKEDERILSEFSIRIPVDNRLEMQTISQENVLDISAFDWSDTITHSYLPLKEPENKDVQQAFTNILLLGVKELLSITPSPALIPSSFQ